MPAPSKRSNSQSIRLTAGRAAQPGDRRILHAYTGQVTDDHSRSCSRRGARPLKVAPGSPMRSDVCTPAAIA
jgi:hypothetical protein